MSGLTDVFGGQTVPPSEYAFAAYSISSDAELVWPNNYSGTNLLLASITEFSASSGLSVRLPPANLQSVGKDFLLRNTGSQSISILDNLGGAVTSVDPGVAKYFYITDNSTSSGVWSVFTYGTGTSGADATLLAGAGLQPNNNELQVYADYFTVNANYSVTIQDRARLLDIVSGTNTISLPQASSVGTGFYLSIRNSASGNVTVDGYSSETVDGSSVKNLAPSESAIFVCNGVNWITVGYGRSSTFVFSELVLSAVVPSYTLTSASVSGRMIRMTGVASANVIVTLPSVNNIYFVNVESGMGVYNVTFKTAGVGSTVVLNANQSTVLYCDGTNVSTGINFIQASSLSLDDGSALSPTIRYTLDLSTGLYRAGVGTIGFTSQGVPTIQISDTALVPATPNTYDLGTSTIGFRNLYATGTGSSIGWIRAAAGAVATKIGTWMGWQEPSLFDFMSVAQITDVMAGTLGYDLQPVFTSALATGRPIKVLSGSGWKYRIDSAVSVSSGAYIKSDLAYIKLADGANSHMFQLASGADNVTIEGLYLDGNGANNAGGNCISSSTSGAGVTNVTIRNNFITSADQNGVSFGGTTIKNINVLNNRVTACGTGGISCADTIELFKFDGNFSWLNGTHGVGLLGVGKNGVISNNVCWDNGQSIPNADNLTGYNNACDSLVIANNVSKGGLNNGIHFGGTNISYIGNTSSGAAKYGIAHSPPAGGSCDNMVMVGNLAYGSGLSGFYYVSSSGGTVVGNRSLNNANHGFLTNSLSRYTFIGNVATGNGNGGFSNGSASTTLTLSGNNFSGNSSYGVSLANVTASTIISNQVNNNLAFGIVGGGTEGENVITLNNLINNTSGPTDSLSSTSAVFGNVTSTGAASLITGTGKIVLGTSPVFTTGITTPLLLGGSATNQSLIYKTTSGVGVAGADHIFQVGNNGSTEALRILNNGKVGINNASPSAQLDIGVPSGGDALRISNTSLTSRGWEFYPVTNGTNTDLRLFEFAGASGDRARFLSGGTLEWLGQLSVATAGKGLSVKEGANAKQGTATLVAGTVTVANTSVGPTSRIFLTSQSDGGTPGFLRVSSRSNGVSFTITSSSNTDTSVVAYEIFEQA